MLSMEAAAHLVRRGALGYATSHAYTKRDLTVQVNGNNPMEQLPTWGKVALAVTMAVFVLLFCSVSRLATAVACAIR